MTTLDQDIQDWATALRQADRSCRQMTGQALAPTWKALMFSSAIRRPAAYTVETVLDALRMTEEHRRLIAAEPEEE